MNYTIANHYLTVSISSIGGELQSILGKDKTEYLWQGDINSWPTRAINIFPYVGRLTKDQYTYQCQSYNMSIHGFLSRSEMIVEKHTENSICFLLESNEETLRQYPFLFAFRIHYRLMDEKIDIEFEVQNKDHKTMYFGVGGHPGFQVPNEKGLCFEDYYLEFRDDAQPISIGMTDTCYVNGKERKFLLRENRCLDLKQNLFNHDAIILRDMSKEVTLKARGGNKEITVTYEMMNYLGLWNWPTKDVPYVCIEPWSSLPSRQDVIEALEYQNDLISLEPNKEYKNHWSIKVKG